MSSVDEKITTNLIETLEDGRKGFAEAAQKLAEINRPDLSTKFNAFSAQRATFSAELETLATAYGDDIDESGSVLGAAHRGWMSIKDILAGSNPDGVIEAALQGESYANKQFTEALEAEISTGLREVIVRQFADIQRVESELSSMRVAA